MLNDVQLQKYENFTHFRILHFIESIRESFPEAERVYKHGHCLDFYFILKSIFPDAEAYYDSNHVITKIGFHYYDITGEVEKGRHLLMREHYPELLANKKLEG